MKCSRYLLLIGLFLLPLTSHSAETAQARLYCLSLQFQQSTNQNNYFTLDLTTVSFEVNGELAYGDFFGLGYSHASHLILTDQSFGDQYEGALELNVPAG